MSKSFPNPRGHRFSCCRRWLNLFVCVAATGLAILGSEVVFRFLLFSDFFFLEGLKRPGLYADDQSSDDYWKLRVRFGAPPAPRNDPLLGHRKPDILPGSYTHREAGRVGPRKPVLLYGDSFADCATPRQDCFDGILNGHESFSVDYYLLNYGVGGIGLDQIDLLYRESIGHYLDPIVILSLLDDDIDRCVLTMREGQKPFFELEGGRLRLAGLPIEPDQKKFFAERPPDITCYLCRLAWFSLFPSQNSANHPRNPTTKKKKEIAAAIILRLASDLKARNVKHVFLVFEGIHRTYQRPLNWRIDFLSQLFSAHGIPHLWSRTMLEDALDRGSFRVRDYVVSDQDPHPNGAANRIIAQGLIRWLEIGTAGGLGVPSESLERH